MDLITKLPPSGLVIIEPKDSMKPSKEGKHPLVIPICDTHKRQQRSNDYSCILAITNSCLTGPEACPTGGKSCLVL